MTSSEQNFNNLLPRLCTEIQLFDLCDVVDACTFKNGRFCAEPVLLSRFEKIADEEKTLEQYLPEEMDAEEDTDGYDEFSSEGVEDSEDDGWEDEE